MAEHSRTGVIRETGQVVEIGPPHPVAALFPLMDRPELEELAASIREQGQLEPVLIESNGQHRLIDGLNRVAACELADLPPEIELWEGDDPTGMILGRNITRRHLSTGARAILAEQARRLTGNYKSVIAETDPKLNAPRLAEAATVLDWEPALAAKVVAGDMALSDAVEQARQRKREVEGLRAKRERLRTGAEDLWVLVDEERMDLDEAIAALEERERRAAEQRQRDQQAEEQIRQEEDRDRRQSIEAVQEGLARFLSGVPGLIALCPDPGRWPVTIHDLERAEDALRELKERMP